MNAIYARNLTKTYGGGANALEARRRWPVIQSYSLRMSLPLLWMLQSRPRS